MQKKDPPDQKGRLLFNRLASHHRDLDTLAPLQRRKSTGGRASTRHQPQKLETRRRASYQAAPLVFTHLPPRTRCLTPSPFESPSELQLNPRADKQTQSLLFTLPGGILLMIYKEILGDRMVHIMRRQRKLGHTICESMGDFEECREEQCRGLKLPSGTYVHTGEANGNSVQLLQTCRRIYVDAIPILYSSNTFDFDSMEGFISLSCALLSQRFDSIQSVKLDFRFNLSLYFSETTCFNDWPRWERTWRIFSTMGSLQRLRARISWPKEGLYDREEKRYLEPMWILTNMEIFEVSLPPLKDREREWGREWAREHEEVPYRIIRRTRN